MNSHELLRRAQTRREMVALAMQRVAIKVDFTPHELRQHLEKVEKLQSIFGAPNDSKGNPTGKAGRTVVFMKKWLAEQSDYGLPPVGEKFKIFVGRVMDSANHIWGQEEAIRDICRDIAYNFHFNPLEVNLVDTKQNTKPHVGYRPKSFEEKEEKKEVTTPPPEKADLGRMSPMLQPNQGPLNMPTASRAVKLKAFASEFREEGKDNTSFETVPVVTRQDYIEDIDKAKKASDFPKDDSANWNNRNRGVNDLLRDLKPKDYEVDSDRQKEEEKQIKEYTKDNLYPTLGFTRSPIKKFAAEVDEPQKKN